MAIAYDNSARGFSLAAAATVSTASFAVAGDYLLVGVINSDGSPTAPTSVKWGGAGGTAMTQIGTTITLGSFGRMTWWELKAPTVQTSTAIATWAGNQGEKGIIAVAYSGVDQTTPKGTVAQAEAASSAAITVNAVSVAGDLVVDFAGFLDTGGGNRTLLVGAGQTSRQEIEGTDLGSDGCGASEETAAGVSTTMSWTISSASIDEWGTFAVALKAAAASDTLFGQALT